MEIVSGSQHANNRGHVNGLPVRPGLSNRSVSGGSATAPGVDESRKRVGHTVEITSRRRQRSATAQQVGYYQTAHDRQRGSPEHADYGFSYINSSLKCLKSRISRSSSSGSSFLFGIDAEQVAGSFR